MPSTRTAVRPTMDLRIALLLLLDLSPRPPRVLPGRAGLYGCHARLVQAAEPICSRGPTSGPNRAPTASPPEPGRPQCLPPRTTSEVASPPGPSERAPRQ